MPTITTNVIQRQSFFSAKLLTGARLPFSAQIYSVCATPSLLACCRKLGPSFVRGTDKVLFIFVLIISTCLNILYSRERKVDKELSLLTIPLFPLSRLPRIFLEYLSTMSRPTSKVKRPTRKSLGSHRSSLSAQKTEILINVYDLLPVRIPF